VRADCIHSVPAGSLSAQRWVTCASVYLNIGLRELVVLGSVMWTSQGPRRVKKLPWGWISGDFEWHSGAAR
jgi:hypothetical protein